ncbi:unknown similar to AMEV151 [Choristoneura rosaceana entomopoxvirus 'L']|uniref:Uncharacterized protein n=1 Tax=Choristoneura rosaceana entomopoxvirus 'L' TaxID=1293539 RepID=A0ABM9QKJ7_9POXV|nr:unknown similar to AMEV151 [Choristoneura rosaceana entomopoxvirus 'L']CCU56067.1 unknown similar to AMEV151 [Choristoneura rosaceana entomopoxvirus 'L']
MTDTTTDVVTMKLANDIANMPSYVKVVKINNRMNGMRRELLAVLNTSQFDSFMNTIKGITGMFSNGALHESLIGSLNKGYYNEMEAGATDGGFGPQGKNLPSNNPNRQRYEQYGRTSNSSNQNRYDNNNSRYDRYDNNNGNSSRYYNNDSNDYDNGDMYGQGPGCTPNVDGSRDRRCRSDNNNNGNYQNQGGTPANVGDKLTVDKSLLSTILTR